MEGNWKFTEGEAKSGGLGLLNMMQDLGGFSGGIDNQYIVLDADEGVMAFYGDRGDGTIEVLAVISTGFGTGPCSDAIASFGSFAWEGTGVVGMTDSGYGVWGESDNDGIGVAGFSVSGSGGDFICTSGYGLSGYSTSGVGVNAGSDSNTGVYGHSTSGYGVSGSSTNTYGGYFDDVYVIGTISAGTVTDRP